MFSNFLKLFIYFKYLLLFLRFKLLITLFQGWLQCPVEWLLSRCLSEIVFSNHAKSKSFFYS